MIYEVHKTVLQQFAAKFGYPLATEKDKIKAASAYKNFWASNN